MDLNFIPFIILLIAIFVSWLGPVSLGVLSLACAVVAALIFDILQPSGAFCVFILGLSLWAGTRLSMAPLRWLSMMGFVALAVSILNHALPGLNNLLVFDKIKLSASSAPFSMYLNFDKAVLGIFIYLFFLKATIEKGHKKGSIRFTLKTLILLLALILPAALLTDYVKFDPKFPPEFLIWSLNNLFFVCLAEEALFRGFIQGSLSKLMPYSRFPVALSAVLFGLAHYQGGTIYMLLATFAGFFYGYVYWKTKKLQFSMLIHFGLNTVHFLLFSYPWLIQA